MSCSQESAVHESQRSLSETLARQYGLELGVVIVNEVPDLPKVREGDSCPDRQTGYTMRDLDAHTIVCFIVEVLPTGQCRGWILEDGAPVPI